ncbi:MAG: hypothetical protein GY721_12665, partial [Deltaproteobacteria bacterium]|nr:hypothetical protein [Deltaproteobacteria bacterium]
YHLHVLVTEGGMDERGKWRDQPYISYEGLRKIWQYEVLERLREEMETGEEEKGLIDRMFREYRKGFYVHASPRVKEGEGISRYIGRYIRHPAIADKRIEGYDGETVTISYKERGKKWGKVKKLKKMPVLEFIHGVVRHIPPKQFKPALSEAEVMVRYYGLYAPRKASRVKEIMQAIGRAIGRQVHRLLWRQRILRDFQRDPLKCPRCGAGDMELFSLTIRDRGGGLVIIGGWKWLFERGSIVDARSEEPSSPSVQKESQAMQLAFAF